MLSVGLFTYSTKPRGSVVHAACLAEALSAAGNDVTLYALSKPGDQFYRKLSCPVRLMPARPAPENPDALIRQRIDEFVSGLHKLRPKHDVYHAEDCLSASGLLGAEPTLGLSPIVRTLHHVEQFKSAYLQECQRRSILETDAVACVSKLTQRDVAGQFGRSCPIIGNGVDERRFGERCPERELMLRERLGISAKDVVVLSVGGVEPRKNTLRSLLAMEIVHAAQADIKWLIVGGASIWEHDAYRASFQKRLEQVSPALRKRVVQVGPVAEEDLTSLYQMSDVLLCPSLQEGFGLCVLEALCAKTAVIVADDEPFTEYLDEHSATFVDPESVSSIAHALHELVTSRRLRESRIVEGLTAAGRHSWEKVARAHARLYRAVLKIQSVRPAAPRLEGA